MIFPIETGENKTHLIKKKWFRSENTDYYLKVLVESQRYYGNTLIFNEKEDRKVQLNFIRFLNYNGKDYKEIGTKKLGRAADIY